MWSLRHVLKIPNSNMHVYMQTCKRLVNRRLINSWILSLRKFLIKRQIIEYYSKKCLYTCKLRSPTTPPHRHKNKPQKKQQQQNNQPQKNPQNKKVTPKRSFEFKCLRNHDCSIYEIISTWDISKFLGFPYCHHNPPPTPPPPE